MTAIVTPAYITYTPSGQGKQTIKFHSVISEEHGASSVITQFPVQTGFMISNNSIRQNRKVTVRGIISNNLIRGGATAYEYSNNNCRTIFDALESLVNSGVTCEVFTNLGIYNPVVFTSFNTTQQQGMIDSMEFTITGEEVQVADSVIGTAPRVVPFTEVDPTQKNSIIASYNDQGIEICECNEMLEASVELGEDFVIEDVNDVGNSVSTTYISRGQDAVSGDYIYDVHTSDTDVFRVEANGALVGANPDQAHLKKLVESTGMPTPANCFLDNAETIATEAATELVATAMGELTKTLYGALYKVTTISSNEYGQQLINAGIGCLIRGRTGFPSEFPFSPGEALPTADEIVSGAINYGKKKFGTPEPTAPTTGAETITTLTKIECCL